jgi:hypothetical protein
MFALLDVLGKIWTLPNTVIGLVTGTAALCFGATPRLRHNALVFFNCPFLCRGAVTLGNVILTTEPSLDLLVTTYALRCNSSGQGAAIGDLVHLGKHEEAHTYQYQMLGPFFLPVYCIAGIGRQVSAFEQAADRYARTGAGWWP